MKIKNIMGRSISEKMFGVILVLVLLPIIIFAVVEYSYTRSVMDESSYQYLASVAGVMTSRLQDSINNIEEVAFFVNGNQRIQDALVREKNIASEDRIEHYKIYDSIVKELQYISMLQMGVNSVHIVADDGKRYSYWKNKNTFVNYDVDYKSVQDIKWAFNENNIYLMKKMYSFPEHESIGVQIIDVDTRILHNAMDEIELGEEGNFYLVDENGIVVASSRNNIVGESVPSELAYLIDRKESFNTVKGRNGTIAGVYSSKALSNGWSFFMTVSMDIFRQNIARIRNMIIVATIVIAVVATLVSRLVVRRSSSRIVSLRDSMNEFAQGNFEVSCDVASDDEVGDLSRTFNSMVADINSLVNNVYEQKLLKQKAQMESLQLQINPHFLYNTLDTINWMSRMKGADDVADVVVALGSLMRYSLSKNSFVTIGEEVKNLENYLYIQRFRYGDKMQASLEIDESLYEYYIPKLLIQPILENAIVHGIEEKIDPGYIVVYAEKKEEDIFIIVEDDGVGMTEDSIEKVFSEDEKAKKKGHTSVGIVNVNKRIRMVYGNNYGINIQSVLGAGTKMTLHIKAFDKAPEQ